MVRLRCGFVLALLAEACGGSGGAAPGVVAGWTALKPMPVPLGEAAAAAFEGKIYVAGGYNTRSNFQIYDTAAGIWEVGPGLPAGTDNAGVVAAGGKVYVFGGEDAQGLSIYEIASRTWARGTDLPAPRFSSVVANIDGRVHLVGGWSFDRSDNVSLATHHVFDLASQTYPAGGAPMLTPRNHAASGVIGGKLYVAGGRSPGHEAADGANLASAEVYDPAANAWTAIADLPTPRSGAASTVAGGKLYVLGGSLPGARMYKTVERYDPSSGQWQTLADMPAFATGHCAVTVGTDIYVIGGFAQKDGQRQGFTGVGDTWRYSPQSAPQRTRRTGFGSGFSAPARSTAGSSR